MRLAILLVPALGICAALVLAPACGKTDDGDGNTTTTTTTGGGGSGGSALEWIGGDCTCTGADCDQLGVPKPAAGTISGCSEVPASWPGAALVCLRSYDGGLATSTYFANGFCSLMATACTGAALVCDSAVYGDHAAMTSCPAGSVLISDSVDVDVFGNLATIDSKKCAPACTGAGECREDETDPALAGAATEYQCNDKGGVKFCYDPRNLGPNYTAEAF